jgi:hypothetical protein
MSEIRRGGMEHRRFSDGSRIVGGVAVAAACAAPVLLEAVTGWQEKVLDLTAMAAAAQTLPPILRVAFRRS